MYPSSSYSSYAHVPGVCRVLSSPASMRGMMEQTGSVGGAGNTAVTNKQVL